MKLFAKFVIGILFASTNNALSVTDRFYPEVLQTRVQCSQFAVSEYDVARANVFLDHERIFRIYTMNGITLAHCLAVFISNRRKTLIFIVNQFDFDDEELDLTGLVNSAALNVTINIEMIAQINLFNGPGGHAGQTAHGLNLSELQCNVIFSASETESLGSYSQAFFDSFNKLQQDEDVTEWNGTRYIQLNGWLLKHMGRMAVIQVAHLFDAFIVYVSRESSHMISTHQATIFLPDAPIPVFLDMAFSPEFLESHSTRITMNCGPFWIVSLLLYEFWPILGNLFNKLQLLLLTSLSSSGYLKAMLLRKKSPWQMTASGSTGWTSSLLSAAGSRNMTSTSCRRFSSTSSNSELEWKEFNKRRI